VLIKLFSLGVTAEALLLVQNRRFPSNEDRLTQSFSYQKTRLNDLSYGIKIWTDLSSILSRITRLTDRQIDGRTDRILIARPRLHCMQRGKKQVFLDLLDSTCYRHRLLEYMLSLVKLNGHMNSTSKVYSCIILVAMATPLALSKI